MTEPAGAVGPWETATVTGIRDETATAKTFRLRLPAAVPRRAGQHYVLRLTAPDGYRAQRSYSVANAPGDEFVELTVERLPDGEVSGFLHDDVRVGDLLDVRGPIGYFGWDGSSPVVGIAGGSGVVPIMAMLRAARRRHTEALVRAVVSVRAPDSLYYADELVDATQVRIVYTRQAPPGASRRPARLDADDLGPVAGAATVFVSGSPAFCDRAAALVLAAGTPADRVRVERFGPTG